MRRMMLIFVLLGLVLALVAPRAEAAERTPRLKGTIGWVPGFGYKNASGSGWTASTVYCLDTSSAFGRRVDVLTMRSSADFDLFIMQTTKLANDESMSTSASVAQIDSLLNFTQTVPAAGEVFAGHMPWLVAPAAADTLWISGYVLE